MSRHELTPRDETVSCITVGWDRPLGTFFAHVYLTADDNEFDIPTHAIGEDFHEVTDPAQVIDMVRPYADVPATLAATLRDDAQAEGTCEAPAVVAILSAPAQNTADWFCPF